MTSRRTCEQSSLREDSGPLASRFLLPTYAAISGDAVRVTDPFDFPVKFFHEIEHAERLIQRYDLHQGAPIACLELEHMHPDIPAAYAHYQSLGFGCSEAVEGDEHELYAAWLYRKQTAHDVAFTGGAGPRLHHLGVATHETHQVLCCADIFSSLRTEHHIVRTPGRHGVCLWVGTAPVPRPFGASTSTGEEGRAGRGTARLQGHGVRCTVGALPTVPFPTGLQDERARECSTHSSGSLMGIGGRYWGGGRRDVRCSRSRGRLTARRFHRPTDCGGTPGSKSRR